MTALPLTTSYWPADTSSPVLETTIGGVLRAAAGRAPGQPALISGDPDPARRRQWRYGELLAEAERGAHALIARFRPGDRVAVWAGNCPEWVLLEFAAGLAGVTLVTVNPAYQADELAHVLGHSGARGIFLAAEHRGSSLPAILATVRGRLPELREVIPLGEWDGFCASGDGGRLPEVDPASPAQILYTSGTTGRPKAAVLTHRGLTNNARLAADAMGMRAGEAGVNPMPLFHVAGGGLLTLGIVQSTGTQVLMPHFDPGLALELNETYRGVCFGGVPTMLTALLGHPGLRAARPVLAPLRDERRRAGPGGTGAAGGGHAGHPVRDHFCADRVELLDHGDPARRHARRPGGDRRPAAAADRGEDHRPAHRRDARARHDRRDLHPWLPRHAGLPGRPGGHRRGDRQ